MSVPLIAVPADGRVPAVYLPARPTGEELRAAPSLKAAMHDLDRRRARSRQKKIGASEVGECRRRAAYRIARRKPTNQPTGLQAALGTAIHKDVLRALVRMHGGLAEVKVESEQIKGSADWVHFDTQFYDDFDLPGRAPSEVIEIEDLKTTSKGGFEKVLTRGPYTKHWYQVSIYGFLMRIGAIRDRRLLKVGTESLDVTHLRIRYLSRDSGEDACFTQPYDPFLAAEAIAWLADVYAAVEEDGPEEVPRDGFGPGVDSMCDYCPFLDACWGPPLSEDEVRAELSRQSRLTVTDADFAQAVRDYDESRNAESEAKRRKEYARERLRGRTGTAAGLHCAWTGGNERTQVDTDAALTRLVELGEELPVKTVRRSKAIRVVRVAGDDAGG